MVVIHSLLLSYCMFAIAHCQTSQLTVSQNSEERMEYDQLLLKSYKYWEVYLHENQCYLGRVFVLLKDGKNVEDFLDIDGEVREEFFIIGEKVKSALSSLFKPD